MRNLKRRSIFEESTDYMELIGKEVEIDGDNVTIVDIKSPELRDGVTYYTLEFDDDSVIDLTPEEMDALAENGNVWAYATNDDAEDVFMTIVDLNKKRGDNSDDFLNESIISLQSIRRKKILESLNNKRKLNEHYLTDADEYIDRVIEFIDQVDDDALVDAYVELYGYDDLVSGYHRYGGSSRYPGSSELAELVRDYIRNSDQIGIRFYDPNDFSKGFELYDLNEEDNVDESAKSKYNRKKLNESRWSRPMDDRFEHPYDWEDDEKLGRREPLRDTQFKSETSRRLHDKRMRRSLHEHSADLMFVLNFDDAIDSDVSGAEVLDQLISDDIISNYKMIKPVPNLYSVMIEDESKLEDFRTALSEYFDEETLNYIIDNVESHDVSESEDELMESKLSKIRKNRMNEGAGETPKSPNYRRSIKGKKITLYKLDELTDLLSEYKAELKELNKDKKYAEKKSDEKCVSALTKKIESISSLIELISEEIKFRKKNKMNESVTSKFSRRIFESEDEDDDKSEEDDKSEDDDSKLEDPKDDDKSEDDSEEEIKDMVAIQLTVKDTDKVKSELISAGIPEEGIEIIKDAVVDEDPDKAENGEIKVDADYAIELKDYLKGKGIDLEEKIGGEIVTDDSDDEESDKEDDKKDDSDEQSDLDIFGEEDDK